jgi:Flp pilus assembly protein TadG
MLEFTLVAGVFFGAIFATFEITRYLSINTAVSSATQVASSYAAKVVQ